MAFKVVVVATRRTTVIEVSMHFSPLFEITMRDTSSTSVDGILVDNNQDIVPNFY